jgi:hypothetical protein
MDFVLLDWTRMGRSYCLAGVVPDGDTFRVVRPLPVKFRTAPVRNVGWSAYLLDGHCRWEVFELAGPSAALVQAPHVEDVWVRSLLPRRILAPPGQRRRILERTALPAGEDLFGSPLVATRTAAYLEPGDGRRSLTTIHVRAADVRIDACQREGVAEPDVRITLPVPGLGTRSLPLKDHHLLARAEAASPTLDGRKRVLQQALGQMGDTVAVRVGLTRSFQPSDSRAPGKCWLMVDGLFSLADPQP